VLSKKDIEMLLLQKPQVAIRLPDAISQRLQETLFKLEEIAHLNATVRVCRALFRISHDSSRLKMTHQELADSTGLFRETVTNILDRLQSLGIVKLSRKKIVILYSDDYSKLQRCDKNNNINGFLFKVVLQLLDQLSILQNPVQD
jgi:CRP/FNR family transcriptional regulator